MNQPPPGAAFQNEQYMQDEDDEEGDGDLEGDLDGYPPELLEAAR